MRRLLLTLWVAAVIAGAPVAVLACQWSCASSDHASSTAAAPAVHTCHQSSGTATPVASLSAIHVCGHSDELPYASQSVVLALAAPAPSVLVTIAGPELRASGWRVAGVDPSPPDRLARTGALRI